MFTFILLTRGDFIEEFMPTSLPISFIKHVKLPVLKVNLCLDPKAFVFYDFLCV